MPVVTWYHIIGLAVLEVPSHQPALSWRKTCRWAHGSQALSHGSQPNSCKSGMQSEMLPKLCGGSAGPAQRSGLTFKTATGAGQLSALAHVTSPPEVPVNAVPPLAVLSSV